MNDATYPDTYRNSAGSFIVMRTERVLEEHKTLLNITKTNHSVALWLTDAEVDALATLLRECHDTSKPLFKEAA